MERGAVCAAHGSPCQQQGEQHRHALQGTQQQGVPEPGVCCPRTHVQVQEQLQQLQQQEGLGSSARLQQPVSSSRGSPTMPSPIAAHGWHHAAPTSSSGCFTAAAAAAAATPAAAEAAGASCGSEEAEEAQECMQQQQQESGGSGGKPHQGKPARPRPTHFVSLRVSHSPQVVSCIEAVQAQLLQHSPELAPCLLEPITAHLTIMVLHLPSKAHEAAASALLPSLCEVLAQQGLGRLGVHLEGLSTFRNQVLYLDVAPGPARERLQQLGHCVISHFRDAGSDLAVEEPGRGFTPHVTIAKTSRLLGRQKHKHRRGKGGAKIPPEAWASLARCDAGWVDVAELQVCSMQGRREGEFYRVTHTLQLPEASPPPSSPLPPPPSSAVAPPPSEQAAAAAAAAPSPQAPTSAAAVPGTAAPTPPGTGNGTGALYRQPRRRPLAVARQRFKRLLRALACGGGKERGRQPARVDAQQHDGGGGGCSAHHAAVC